MTPEIDEIKRRALPVLKAHGVRRAGLFGSVARSQAKPHSDIDLLVQIDRDISLLDFIGIKLDLEDALGCKVDLVEYDAVRPALRSRVLQEQVPIL